MQFLETPVVNIKVGDRFRKDYKDIKGLAASISEVGLLEPIVTDREFNLLAGGRRLEAFKLLELPNIPIVMVDADDELDRRTIEMVENSEREGLEYPEEVALTAEIDRLMKLKHGDKAKTPRDETAWNYEKTGKLTGKKKTQVSDDIQLNEMIQLFPDLAKCKNKFEATKQAKKIAEGVVMAELLARQAESGELSPLVEFGEESYIIGDAINGLIDIPNDSIDMLEVDPPFGIDLSDMKKGSEDNRALAAYTEVDAGEYGPFIESVIEECYRVLKPNSWCIFWFGIAPWYETVLYFLEEKGFRVDPIPCIWTKPTGQCQQPEKFLSRNYETFFMAAKGNPVIHKRGRSNIFTFSPVPPQNKIHSTEKPLDLMNEIFQVVAPISGTVVIPFLGSGVSLLAARNRGLKAYGWDLSQEHKDKFIGKLALME